jgi:hypothetical protein
LSGHNGWPDAEKIGEFMKITYARLVLIIFAFCGTVVNAQSNFQAFSSLQKLQAQQQESHADQALVNSRPILAEAIKAQILSSCGVIVEPSVSIGGDWIGSDSYRYRVAGIEFTSAGHLSCQMRHLSLDGRDFAGLSKQEMMKELGLDISCLYQDNSGRVHGTRSCR